MKKYIKILFGLICLMFLTFCNNHTKTADKLSKAEINYIKGLGILDENEPILLFDTQGGVDGIKVSGNFFTNKRIASYWIDNQNKSKTSINFAFYYNIDTIIATPCISSLTNASYLTVKQKDQNTFKVYNDGDSSEVWNFFNKAIAEWIKNKYNKY
jgi:hypothetical protein